MMPQLPPKPFRIGLLGGMGPAAGVELHRLIIEATPATRDQDHLQVVLYTDPTIPDRTTSLAHDAGAAYAAGVIRAARVLEATKPNVIALACMTAHARLPIIQAAIDTPIISGIAVVTEHLATLYSGQTPLLLATTGSVESGVYTRSRHADWQLPNPILQTQLMAAIYAIKGGEIALGLRTVTEILTALAPTPRQPIVLGCTELGLLHDALLARGYEVVDPLRLLAQQLVRLASASVAQ